MVTLPPTSEYWLYEWILHSGRQPTFPATLKLFLHRLCGGGYKREYVCWGGGENWGSYALSDALKSPPANLRILLPHLQLFGFILNMKAHRQSYIHVSIHIPTSPHQIWPLCHVLGLSRETEPIGDYIDIDINIDIDIYISLHFSCHTSRIVGYKGHSGFYIFGWTDY